jgi:hypothetical protein
VLEPVEGALARQGGTVRTPRRELAGEDRQHRVVPQPVVVDQVLVTERDPDHPLADEGRHLVLDPLGGAPIVEAGGEPLDEPDRPVGGAQEQRPGIRGHGATVERRHHATTFHGSKIELVGATLCRHRGAPLLPLKSLLQNDFRRFRAPMHLPFVRNPG